MAWKRLCTPQMPISQYACAMLLCGLVAFAIVDPERDIPNEQLSRYTNAAHADFIGLYSNAAPSAPPAGRLPCLEYPETPHVMERELKINSRWVVVVRELGLPLQLDETGASC